MSSDTTLNFLNVKEAEASKQRTRSESKIEEDFYCAQPIKFIVKNVSNSTEYRQNLKTMYIY